MEIISTVYTEDGIAVPARNEADSLYQDGYGSLLGDGRLLKLRPCEVLYLVERRRIAVIDEGSRRKLVFQELLWRFTSDDLHIWTRYLVYRDLRSRGFVVRDGAGPDVEFLVYQRGSYGRRPPRYLVHAVWEGEPESIGRLREVLEAAEADGLTLRLAVIDRRGEIVYYTLSEIEFKEMEFAEPEA